MQCLSADFNEQALSTDFNDNPLANAFEVEGGGGGSKPKGSKLRRNKGGPSNDSEQPQKVALSSTDFMAGSLESPGPSAEGAEFMIDTPTPRTPEAGGAPMIARAGQTETL